MKRFKSLLGVIAIVCLCGFGPQGGMPGTTGPAGPAGPAPTGNAPQIVGYSAANTVEAETLSGGGDCGTATLARAGANSYTLTTTCLSSNGNAFTSVAFGTALNLSMPPVIGGTTPAAGTFTNINAVFDAGTVGSGGTLTCNMSGASICTATAGAGAITIAQPTNMVSGRQYYLRITSTGIVNMTWNSTWKITDVRTGALVSPSAVTMGASGSITTIPFVYDGTANQLLNWASAIISTGQVISNTFSGGSFAGTTGTFTGLLNTQAVAVASLPATCVKNAIITVTDATSLTAGACVGGGTTSVLAICSATNTWSCL